MEVHYLLKEAMLNLTTFTYNTDCLSFKKMHRLTLAHCKHWCSFFRGKTNV